MTKTAAVVSWRWAAMAAHISNHAHTAATKPPAVQADGTLDLQETSLIDFENGKIVANQNLGADLWFEATQPGQRFLTPVSGAAISKVETFQSRSHGLREYAGCAVAAFSKVRVPLSAVPVGGYVCVRTRDGHIAQFHLISIAGDPKGTNWITLKIGYATWKKP
jgi:hypothetical protein